MSISSMSVASARAVEAGKAETEARPLFSLSGLFARISDALYDSERRRNESDVARFIENNGGVLTDDLERQISRRYGRIVE